MIAAFRVELVDVVKAFGHLVIAFHALWTKAASQCTNLIRLNNLKASPLLLRTQTSNWLSYLKDRTTFVLPAIVNLLLQTDGEEYLPFAVMLQLPGITLLVLNKGHLRI
jgi:hypothetical protein